MSLRNAFAHLTAIRVPPRTREPLAYSVHYFPWLGAAIGSLNILFFLFASGFVPVPAACLLAVIVPQALAGFAPWRGVIEATQGIRTFPGHAFPPGFRPDLRGLGAVAVLVIVKWTALVILPPDWQVRAVFVFPILGTCARTAAFLREPPPLATGDSGPVGVWLKKRRVRAGFLVGLLGFLVFLFPLRAAGLALLGGTTAGWIFLRLRHPLRGEGASRLTLQSAALVAEIAETAVLAGLVAAGLLPFRI